MKLLKPIFATLGLLLLAACSDPKATANETKPAEQSQAAGSAAAPATTNRSEPAAAPAKPAEQQTLSTGASAQSEVAVIKTTEGEMVVEFWPDVAPKTVENFKKLAKEKFYDGTAFHRIIKGFMIQGGDPLTKDPANKDRFGTGDPGYKIKAEFNPRKHERGVISMARSSDPDSAGSQFFICLAPQPMLDGKYTTFGKLIKGDEVLESIGNTPVSPNAYGEPSVPEKRVEVQSITIVPANSVK